MSHSSPRHAACINLNKLLVFLAILALTACFGGGGGGDNDGGGGVEPTEQSINGGGIKGPLVDAIVTAYQLDTSAAGFKGTVAGSPGSTNAQAQIIGLALPFPLTPPYLLEFTSDGDTTDLVTGQAPVISVMRTVITQELLSSGGQIYATPLTTMAVDLAIANADNASGVWAASERDLDSDNDGSDDLTLSLGDDTKTTAEFLTALPIAATQVKSTMGFGIAANISLFDTPPLIDATTVTEAEQEDAAAYRAAVEAVTAVVYQINNATGTEDANAVLSALSADLADGEIDGQADGETSAIYNGESETAGAALQLLEQDPSTLPIPNDPQGRTVGDMKQLVDDEKESLGYEAVETTLKTEEILELKPAETSSDIDNDDVPNDRDAFPEDASESVDTDRDGTGNNADVDDDNDGVRDSDDAFPLNRLEQKDTDGDGVGNNADLDDDGDGVADIVDDFPLDGSRSNKADQDNDGWPSEQDANDNNATIPGTTFVDTDSDGLGDTTDTDDDNDGVPDVNDAFPLNPNEQKDTDGDGTGDNSDDDIDGDGVANAADKFPRNPFESIDTDRDGVGNNTDNDDDGDGVDDAQEIQNGSDPLKRDTDGDGVLDNADQAPTDPEVQFDSDKDSVDNAVDNCPVHYNPTQANLDGDLRGDACDKDLDGDTVDNALDAFPYDADESVDTNGDGVGNNADDDDDGDGVADVNDAFPLNANESVDTDGDGTGNKADSDDDGDGVPDASDAFPLDPSEQLDTDRDGLGNNADTDDDGDGTADTEDAFPLDAAASTDTDSDGIANVTDPDDDGDGVADVDDVFPLNASESVDTDGDGRGNNSDTDDDGDGVADVNDAFPLLASEFKDTDGDGIGNNADTDDDGDGVADTQDAFPLNASESTDTDGDGVGNNTDADDDNDGLSDTQEGVIGSNPLLRDTDGDTKRDGADNCPLVANADQRDSDGDRLGDVCDTDDDGDTVLDGADNCPMTPNTSQSNADGDLLGDACDSDRDGDNVANAVDNCPTTPNADQLDADRNGIGDLCDADADGDRIVDVLDNCPATANADQTNTDGDAQGNACDADDDNDGLSDTEEAVKGTNPTHPDTDRDGVNDRLDAFPLNPSESRDSDGDGIGDNADNDQDADGVVDTADNCPLVSNVDQLNSDGDAQGNVCDNDDDNDGVTDNFDAFPLNPAESQDQDRDTVGDHSDNCPTIANTDQLNTDADGQGNACDDDDDGDGVADTNDAFPLNAGESVDTDGDGIGNNADTDDDGDGVADTEDAFPLNGAETVDTDHDGIGNNADPDDDGDGVSDTNDAFPLNAGESVDTDGDGIGNNADTDDDGDGVGDAEDAFPLDDSETVDTDHDGIGNNADPDDDGDGLSDTEEAAKGTNPLLPDTDGDTVEDGADNCPVHENSEQQDVDEDGVGDACDGVPNLGLYYLNERIVDAETETDNSGLGLCPFDIGDEMTRVSLWLQHGADIKVSFGDEGLNKRGGHLVNIDTSGRVTATITDSHSDREGNIQELELTFDGQLNGANGVISGTVTEAFTFKTAASEVLASCGYSSSETFTPMPQTAASVLFDGAGGSNGGFVWMEANEHHSGSSGQPSFEFFYGLIDNIGETEYRYDATAVSDPWLAVTEHRSSLMLGASGWVAVADSLIVQGTPATTLDLVAKDASDTILAHWQVTPFSASVVDKTMLGLVPRPWSEVGLTAPDAVFADTGVLGVGIHAVSQLDVYEVWCDNYSEGGYGTTLDCNNALIADWPESANPPILASSLSDVLHAPEAVPTETWQGINVAYAEGKELLAYLTGADTSGAEGSSGTVTFYERSWDTGTISSTEIPSSTWEIIDPLGNDTNLVLQFNLPEGLGQAYQISGDTGAIVLAVVNDASDDLPYVRVGHSTAAGTHHYESGLNAPAIEEVKGNFAYVPPLDTDGDGTADDVDVDDDNDGVEDSIDAFPLDVNETEDTDSDGIGNNADTDDDADGISDLDEMANGTDPLNADTDHDTVTDGPDNCPTIPNTAQDDSNSNGIGDLCESVPDMSGFWMAARTISNNLPQTGDSGSFCLGQVGDLESSVVLIKQDGANLRLSFADHDFKGGNGIGTVDAAGHMTWAETTRYDQYDGMSGVEYSVSESWDFTGTLDSTSAPALVTDSAATELQTYFEGKGQSGNQLATCSYTYTASLTRMAPVAAADVLATAGTHQGMSFTDSESSYIEATGGQVFKFSYGVIDDNGEVGFVWDDEAGAWVSDSPESIYMLGSTGWTAVPNAVQVSGTPGVTAELVHTDGVTDFSTFRINTFGANLSGQAFKDFADHDFVRHSANPNGAFANTDSAAIAVDLEHLTDSYSVSCNTDDPKLVALGLTCINAYIADWSRWPVLSQTDLANSLTQVLHADGVSSSVNDKGLWLGRTFEDHPVYAFLNGVDLSGTPGTSGTVRFSVHHFNGVDYSIEPVQDGGSDVQATWEITTPLGGTQAVLSFTIPELLYHRFNIEWRDTPMVILSALQAGDAQSFIRFGGKRFAGEREAFQLLNRPALNELIAGFPYTRPDTDTDGITDDLDNCPSVANNDQADSNENGIGDVCEGTSEPDSDGDGYTDDLDNCPGVPNNDQTDSNENGIGDVCEGTSAPDSDGDGVPNGEDRFPYDPTESADLDEDGVGDNADAFHDNAVEQFDSDGDQIGDNADLCPLVASAVAGVNHSDTDGDGIGNDCDPDQVGSVHNLEGFWLLTGDPADTSQVPDAAEENCVTDTEVGPFYTRAEIKQRGTQIWLHFEGDTMAGTIAPSGDFTLAAMHGSSTVISGHYDGNAFTGLGWTESHTVTNGTCLASGTLALDPGTEVTEQTVIEGGGISWFEADFFWNDFLGVTEQQFFYGTLANADLELMFGYNMDTASWDPVGGDSQNYLTATGTVAADDVFIVDGYATAGESAIIKPTLGGTAVDHEISLVDLRELNVESLPLLTLLDKGYAAGILETDLFSTGARAYFGTITNTTTAYSFDCDNDWEWFATQAMACNNIVAKDWVSNEPVPAASFDDVISNGAELNEMNPGTAAKGLWVGEGDSFKILAFLQTDDGTVAGTYPVVHFLKEFSDMSKFKVGEGTFTFDAVGSTQVLIVEVPESVRRLSHGDDDEGTPFLFVDTDTIDSVVGDVLRRGEIRVESSVEHELLFNSVARDDIKGAFSPSP